MIFSGAGGPPGFLCLSGSHESKEEKESYVYPTSWQPDLHAYYKYMGDQKLTQYHRCCQPFHFFPLEDGAFDFENIFF